MGSAEVDTNSTASGVHRLQKVEAGWINTLVSIEKKTLSDLNRDNCCLLFQGGFIHVLADNEDMHKGLPEFV